MPDDAIKDGLEEAKLQAKEAARAALLAARSALDFALSKLGDDAPAPAPDSDDTSPPAATPPAADGG
jgi:hypothetical protein